MRDEIRLSRSKIHSKESIPWRQMSFFDDVSPESFDKNDFRLFCRNYLFQKDEKPLWEGKLLKQSQNKKKPKVVHAKMTKTHFCYFKKLGKPLLGKGMPLENAQVNFFIKDDLADHEHGIALTRNSQKAVFFTPDQNSFRAFQNASRSLLIQSDYQTRFNTAKQIGKGSFAKVRRFLQVS